MKTSITIMYCLKVLSGIFLTGLVCAVQYECPSGWFGSSCQYKCRCRSNFCDVDGACINGSRCSQGWFGPACQYADLARSEMVIPRGFSPLSVVTDGNEDTCLGASTKEISVRWMIPYQVTWMRVHFQSSYMLNRISVKFIAAWNRQIPCKNLRTFRVSDTAVDIHCDLNVTAMSMILSWEGRSYLCSLYISGDGFKIIAAPLTIRKLPGRNVALKQNTTQTSTDSRFYKTSTSSSAVDGDTSSDSKYGNCAQTGLGDASPKWTVLLSRNYLVNRYLLYHRIDAYYFLRRTYWFTLEGLTTEGDIVFTDRGTGVIRQNVYRVTTAASTSPVGQVNIQSAGNTRRFTSAPATLSLCEVEVYGESICEDGTFGFDCEHTCNCADKNEPCFVSTGGCVSGCVTGYIGEGCSERCPPGSFGQDCKSTCSQLCLADNDDINLCNHINGTCELGCQIGFHGSWCNTTCESGTYGQGCNYECSELCALDGSGNTSSCHHLYGVCLHGCKSGYKGIMCNEPCSPGRYGLGCNLTCSQFCIADNKNITICEHSSGRCLLGCQPGYEGLHCDQACTAGHYGILCKTECPQFCNVSNTGIHLCNHINGSCLFGCHNGYTGQMCDLPCKTGSYGPDCRERCSEFCAVDVFDTNSCHHINGVCLRGCQKGYSGPLCNETCESGTHGEECSSPCPQFCDLIHSDQAICNHINGTCLQGCQAGYTGPTCNKLCDTGMYGQDCSFLCPQFCKIDNTSDKICHHVNGTCMEGCQIGFSGQMCNEVCTAGTFGADCSSRCSKLCDGNNMLCHPADGTCLNGCRSGYTGSQCNEKCQSGKFGLACKFDCSLHCLKLEMSDSACNHVNGSCQFGCQDGYDSHNCTISSKEDHATYVPYLVWVGLAIVGAVLIAAVGAVFGWRRRRQIKSHLLNIAIQVKIRKSSSTENIIQTDVYDIFDRKDADNLS